MAPPSVAIIDIGSNSIKVLVAARLPGGTFATLGGRTLDARISAGISRSRPELGEEGMRRGLDAIRELLDFAAGHAPARIVLVATSAVRDARNGADFRARVFAATGHTIRILSGDEEANLIGRGLTCDPALTALRDFHVFDLGGGSLECLAFRDRKIRQALSLPLGCVRLTEKFVAAPAEPLPAAALAAIAAHVQAGLARAGIALPLPRGIAVVGTGGTLATARGILAARAGRSFEAADPVITVVQLRRLLAELAALPLAARRGIDGLPAGRADVFPTALATLVAVADAGGFDAFHNSLYNLRWGLADETLAALAADA